MISFLFLGQKDNVSKLFKSFRTAWDLVRHELSSQGIRLFCSIITFGFVNVSHCVSNMLLK